MKNEKKRKCQNCKSVFTPLKWNQLFCNPLCKDTAKFIRYVRASTAQKKLGDPEVAKAIRIKRASLLSGGYKEKERRVTGALRDKVIARDKGRCRLCGNPGKDVDHIKGGTNTLANLQFLCGKCHNAKTATNFVVLDKSHPRYFEIMAFSVELDKRINAKKPLKICDDENNWQNIWRTLVK